MHLSSSQTKPARQSSKLNQHLSEIMRKKAMTLSELAKKSGVAIGTIQKLMTDPTCNPTIASLESICDVLEVNVSTLMGQEERLNAQTAKVSLLQWEDLSKWLENANKACLNRSAEIWVRSTSSAISQNAFALKMEGNAMLPLFPEGSILIFDPEKPYKDHSYVLVNLKKHNQLVFKLLLVDAPYRYVKSINPLFQENVILLEERDKVVATLIQAQMSY